MRELLYREAVNEAIREEMEKDNKVFIMGEDIGLLGGVFKTTVGLLNQFGKERVRDTPISESAITSAAAGAAMAGARPIAEMQFMDFAACSMDSIANQIAKMHFKTAGKVSVPIVIRMPGGRGGASASTQSQSLESWFTHIPGLKVVAPSTPYDVKGLLKSSIRDNNPVIFMEHKGLYQKKGYVGNEDHLIPLGKADVKRKGNDATIITYSKEVFTSLEATEELEKKGVEVEVVDLRSLVPLDIKTIEKSVKKTGRVVVVHEAHERSGFGGEIVARIQESFFDFLDAPVLRVASKNVPIPFAPNGEHETAPKKENVIDAVMSIL